MRIILLSIFSSSLIIAASLSFITAIVINFFSFYLRRERSYRHKLRVIASEHDKTILLTKMEMQENMQQYISREIHDNIGLSLTLAKLYLNTISWKQPNDAETHVSDAVQTLTRSIDDLRSLSTSLNADIINTQGLLAAVTGELDRIRATGSFTVKQLVEGEAVYLTPQQDLILFRIIQESFNNIIKHSGAANTSLMMTYDTHALNITIEDDGIGFNLQDHETKTSAGLRNMQSRAKLIGGKIIINSAPGHGTIIQLTIPI